MLFWSNYAKNYASTIRQGLIAYIALAASLPGNIRFSSAERRSLASEPNKNLMTFTAVRRQKWLNFWLKHERKYRKKSSLYFSKSIGCKEKHLFLS